MEELSIRDKILKGAEVLFTKYGVRSISMDDIARHLSVSKKTLYQHFSDKEDIVTLACKAHLDRETIEFDNIHFRSRNAIEELAALSLKLKHNMEELNPSLLFDLKKYHPKAWAVWVNHKNRIIRQSVIRNIKQGIEEGYYRPEINADIISTMRLELVQLAFDEELFPREKFKLPEVQMEIFDHFVHGIATEKGRKLYLKHKEKVNKHQTTTIL
ncbi:TetR/AcrR family transcriptional regulator [Chryseosolibacter indicus]|uniref:TetR/AcrR family transcriptional regulator n=1 Tax=Chryseosolibacter indicus TaxID=2782351 RepID=A0ABS5VWX2_9BACT|nr:TetR/AcrR family transcriptional regulator [Chryseosolibacter indicus]MBT1705335.1 TetR/AcrR family transcriptional regulator [Chryseosolibacter indicus]